ncbi:hypothetical protein EI94DRAFT_1706685 [Lactarius quietus]|nr:hypothetical protein EI94DRAFT_1706685 [Lactarius quietus]
MQIVTGEDVWAAAEARASAWIWAGIGLMGAAADTGGSYVYSGKALESLYGGVIVVRVVIGTHGDFVKNDEVKLSELVVGLPKSEVAHDLFGTGVEWHRIYSQNQMSHRYSFKSTDQICLSEALQERPQKLPPVCLVLNPDPVCIHYSPLSSLENPFAPVRPLPPYVNPSLEHAMAEEKKDKSKKGPWHPLSRRWEQMG